MIYKIFMLEQYGVIIKCVSKEFRTEGHSFEMMGTEVFLILDENKINTLS